jgi:hypothetical protein
MRVLLAILFGFNLITKAQNLQLPKQAFGKNTTVIYVSSGAASRYLDWNKFKPETINFTRTPFFATGFDKCFHPTASNAYWGIGLYISSWFAQRKYVDVFDNLKKSKWSNSLFAIRLSHHNSFYVRKKLDMCSGLIIGTRVKYYHSKTVNEVNSLNQNQQTTFYPAIGITATIRYYFYKNVGFFLDASVGYKTDLLGIGFVYKNHK